MILSELKMKPKHRRSRRYSGRRRTEKNRSVILTVLIMIFIIAIVIGSVFLGKHLKIKAELSLGMRDDIETEDVSQTTETEKSMLFAFKAPASIDIEYFGVDKFSDFSGDKSAVSLVLREHDGVLKYSSPVAQALGGQTADVYLPDANEIISAFGDAYVSVLTVMKEHSVADSYTTALHAFEQAILYELSEAGADEVLLCGFSSLDAEKAEMLCAFSADYHNGAKVKTPIGLIIPYSFFADAEANELCRTLSEHFEFLCVDFSDLTASEEQTIEETVRERVDSMQMYLSRYSLRIILDAENEALSEIKDSLSDAALYSYQSVKVSEIFGENE